MSHLFLNWNAFDYIIAAVLLLFVIVGLVRGFLRELITLISWFVGFYAALKFAPGLSNGFLHSIIANDKQRYIVATILIFLVVIIVGAIINKLIHLVISTDGLGFLDKFLGLIFGIFRGILVVAIILIAIQITGHEKSTWYKDSQLVQHFQPVVMHFIPLLPKKEQAATWIQRLKTFTESMLSSNASTTN
jgi:membrane protein required for colicin V production